MAAPVDPDLVRTVIWAVVTLFALQGFLVYTIVRLLVTGRALFERRPLEEPRGNRIVTMDR